MSVNKITYANKTTKNVPTEADTYKVTAPNLNEIKTVVNNNADELIKNTETIITEEEIDENTNYTIPLYYEVGSNSLEIYYMGEKLVKNVHYIEVGTNGSISNIIQFYDWGQSVPVDRTIEFVVKGVYSNE